MFVNVLGAGDREDSHAVAHRISIGPAGRQHLDRKRSNPCSNGPNPPAQVLVHCVGPAWPRMRNGEVVRVAKRIATKGGYIQRWFEYDWPLTVAAGREREDGQRTLARLCPPTWRTSLRSLARRVAEGRANATVGRSRRSRTRGLLQTPWLEALSEARTPPAYRERLTEVAEFLSRRRIRRDVRRRRLRTEPAGEGHLGLSTAARDQRMARLLRRRRGLSTRAAHDDTTGPLRYFMMAGTACRSAAPTSGVEASAQPTWQSRLSSVTG